MICEMFKGGHLYVLHELLGMKMCYYCDRLLEQEGTGYERD